MKISSQDLKREAFAFAMMVKATAASLERDAKDYDVKFPLNAANKLKEEVEYFLKNIR